MKRALLIRVFAVVLVLVPMLVCAEAFLRVQHYVQLDGFQNRHPWNKVFHHGKGTYKEIDYNAENDGKKIKVLLIGDSWMEDKTLSNEIGEAFADETNARVEVINGGNSSYSPTIYLLKTREAYKEFGKFDAIVVNIDETDIGDELVRYRIPMVRDKKGCITAVPFQRDVHSEYLWNGKLWAEDSPSYLVRLMKFALYYKVLVPLFYDFTYCEDYPTLMKYVFAPDADALYKSEIEYFDDRLLEMVNEISGYTNGPSSVYVTHHPHLRGLVSQVDDGHLYLPVVSKSLQRLRDKTGVTVLDAREHIRQIHGDALLTDTFEKGDLFSHLDKNGAARYGRWLGSEIGRDFVGKDTPR